MYPSGIVAIRACTLGSRCHDSDAISVSWTGSKVQKTYHEGDSPIGLEVVAPIGMYTRPSKNFEHEDDIRLQG